MTAVVHQWLGQSEHPDAVPAEVTIHNDSKHGEVEDPDSGVHPVRLHDGRVHLAVKLRRSW